MQSKACKVLVVGAAGCGQGDLVRRGAQGRMPNDYSATMGVDVVRCEAVLDDGRSVRMMLWLTDSSYGVKIFDHIYAKGAAGALIVADVTRPATVTTMLALEQAFRAKFRDGAVVRVLNNIEAIGVAGRADASPWLVPRDDGVPTVRIESKGREGASVAFAALAAALAGRAG
jgi:GTPase SAR1 family protein